MKLLVFFLLGISCLCFSQDLPSPVQQRLETALEDQEENGEEMNLDLDFFRQNRLDLNQADAADLAALGMFTEIQVQQFILYRKLLGKLLSLYELQAIPGWDLSTIREVLPFVDLGPAFSIKEDLRARLVGSHHLLVRFRSQMEKAEGYKSDSGNHYLGDRSHIQFRYRYQYKNLLYVGWLGEKDPGEPYLMKGRNVVFDFNSAHIFIRKLGMIKSLALGDYLVNLGQGLLVWQGSSFGKSGEVMQVKRQGQVLQPYRATAESGFCRGLGATLGKGNFETSFFISYRKLSGNISDSLLRFSSISLSGLHRTAGEVKDRKRIGLFFTGFQSSFEKNGLSLRMQSVLHRFNMDFQKQDAPYNHYVFRGHQLVGGSLEGSYTYHNMHMYGELAIDQFLHPAFTGGLLLSVDRRMDVALCYRRLSPQYKSLSAQSFSENSTPVNENGIYAGLSLRPFAGWQVQVFGDIYSFPWLRYRVHAPSRGYDYLVQLVYRPHKKAEVFFRFRHRNKPVNGVAWPIAFPVDHLKSGLRFQVNGQLEHISFKSRMEILWLQKPEGREQGYLAFLEGKYGGRFSASLRLQYFETGSYESRIYAYESDVLYASAFPAFYEKGLRYYMNFNYEPGKKFRIWLRWAQTIYPEKKQRGSGLEEINSKSRTEVKLQLGYELGGGG